jgi:hypothetical protein
MTRLTVEQAFRLAGRGWLMVTGVLAGDPLYIGDHIVIQSGEQSPVQTVIRTIEIHSAPGTTTIAVDLGLDELIRPGTVIVRPEPAGSTD